MITPCSTRHSSNSLSVSWPLLPLAFLRFRALAVSATFLFFSGPLCVFADTHIVGDIIADAVWTREGSPYVIDAALTIERGAVLTIESGVSISAVGQWPIRVLGSLIARGRPDEKILFSDMAAIFSFGGKVEFDFVEMRNGGRFFLDEESDMKMRGSTIQTMRDSPAAFMVFGTSTLSIQDSDIFPLNTGFAQVHGGSRLVLADSHIHGYVQRGIFTANSSVDITGSIIEGGRKGIESVDSPVSITDSRISGNSEYAAVTYSPDFPIKAMNVFWGHPSGPFHPSLNPEGKGDKVSNFVDFLPWLSGDPMACCSSVLFLPGFEASRLYATSTMWLGENDVWEPNNDDDADALTMAGDNSINNVYTKAGDILGEAYIPIVGPNIYKSFMRAMDETVTAGTISEWLPISYDWRLSFDQLLQSGAHEGDTISYIQSTSEPYILKEVERLAAGSKTGKVTIIAHSNGGLLAKKLIDILSNKGEEGIIDKIVFVAVPQTGSVQAAGSLLHGFKEGIPFLLSAKAIRRLGLTLPGAYTLLPSTLYGQASPFPFITFDYSPDLPWIENKRSFFGSYVKDPESFADFLGQMGLDEGLISAATAVHDQIDAWEPPAGALLFELAGQGIDTLTGIRYYQGKRLGKPTLFYEPLLDQNGDGTVAAWSALAGPEGSMIQKISVNLAAENLAHNASWAHKDILEVPAVLDLLRTAISFKTLRSRIVPVSMPAEVIAVPIQKTIIFLHAEDATIEARDKAGRRTGRASSSPTAKTEIPGSDYREFGEVSYISVPKEVGDVRFAVSAGPSVSEQPDAFTLDIGQGSSTPISYSDISITASTSISIDIASTSFESFPVLQIDDDGDGSVDREVSPDTSIAVPVLGVQENIPVIVDSRRNSVSSIKQMTEEIVPLKEEVAAVATSSPIIDAPKDDSPLIKKRNIQLAGIGALGDIPKAPKSDIFLFVAFCLAIFALCWQILHNLLISTHKGRRKRGGSKEP